MASQITPIEQLLEQNVQEQHQQQQHPQEQKTFVEKVLPESILSKDFCGLKENDYKAIILVFAIILILSSGIFHSVLRPYVPGSFNIEGKISLVGSIITAILGAIIFTTIKIFAKI